MGGDRPPLSTPAESLWSNCTTLGPADKSMPSPRTGRTRTDAEAPAGLLLLLPLGRRCACAALVCSDSAAMAWDADDGGLPVPLLLTLAPLLTLPLVMCGRDEPLE